MLMIKVTKVQGQIQFLPAGGLASELATRLGTQALSVEAVAEEAYALSTEVVIVEGKCAEAAALLSAVMHPVTMH